MPDGSDKMFILRGAVDAIEYAKQLIYEKVTGVSDLVNKLNF